MTKKSTRRALLASVMSVFLCFTMLLGTTYAWFTDSVVSSGNKIVAGNLDVDLFMWNSTTDSVEITENSAPIFGSANSIAATADNANTLWEPGKTQVAYLSIKNNGNLDLKYQVAIEAYGETNDLLDVLSYSITNDAKYGDVDAWAGNGVRVQEGANATQAQNVVLKAGQEHFFALSIHMDESAGNEYQEGSASFDIKVLATQLASESDSFGPDYDAEAPIVTIKVDPSNVQAYLDGQYGSLDNTKLVLTAGTYGKLIIGTPTKYEGSNTVIYCETHDATFTDAEAYKAHLADGKWHSTPRYTRSINNLTISAEAGVTVAGVEISSGHVHGSGNDYVIDKAVGSGHTYYLAQSIKGLSFENIAFSDRVDINTSSATTTIDDVSFAGCSFEGTSAAAIRYYNESKNGKVSNLTVDNCSFKNCYQGVYTMNINGVTVTNSDFDTTTHNAVAVQGDYCDHGKVVISTNKFNNIGDRIIRFNNIGANTDITITYNVAANSGNADKEVIKATAIAAGVKATVENNDWGVGAVIVNPEFKTGSTTPTNIVFVSSADEMVSAFAALQPGTIIIIENDIDMTGKSISPVTGNKGFTMIGNGYTISNLESSERALFVAHSGSSSYEFDGVVLENCSVNSTAEYGALFVGDGDTSDAITIKNCQVKNCSVNSAKYAAAFVAYTAGYNVAGNGPVYSDVLIENCSVIGSSITGAGSTGAAIGHAGGNDDTTSTVVGLKLDNVAINGEDAAHTGIAVGTAHVGDTVISDVTYSNVTGNYNTATVLYGRFVPGTTGTLVVDGIAK